MNKHILGLVYTFSKFTLVNLSLNPSSNFSSSWRPYIPKSVCTLYFYKGTCLHRKYDITLHARLDIDLTAVQSLEAFPPLSMLFHECSK